MDQRVYIAQLSIKHYRKKLADEADQAKRETLQRLLVDEEAKLAALNDPPGEQSLGPDHSRQCVGRKSSIRFLVSALIQPPRIRRHGNTSACVPS